MCTATLQVTSRCKWARVLEGAGMRVEPIGTARAERAARVYKTNQEAAAALGITREACGRLCRRLGIETPAARAKRLRRG